MELIDHGSQPCQAPRHIPVEIELVPVINPDSGIGLPEHHRVGAAEVPVPAGDELLGAISSSVPIVRLEVIQEQEDAGNVLRGPRKVTPVVPGLDRRRFLELRKPLIDPSLPFGPAGHAQGQAANLPAGRRGIAGPVLTDDHIGEGSWGSRVRYGDFQDHIAP
ncbi:MAG: hypothetical protein HUU17_13615 [Chthonomonadales bacterium]|nr:hypothetical protein [Chthonomonadales bacterium]